MVRAPIAIAITFALQAAAACGYSGGYPPDAGPPADAMPPPWWSPRPGDAKAWDIQLAAPIDVSAARTMYVLDLWSVVPSATTIDYGDNDPVSVPAGALATALATLHATTPRTVVICRIDTGALELARPDARKFPGWRAGLTTCPTTIAAGDSIGKAATAPDECYLDLTAAGAAKWSSIMFKRFDLARSIGCDGIVGDRNDSAAAASGFTISPDDQLAWYKAVAAQTHQRKLSAGMKDAYEIPSFPDMLAPEFDWLLVQRCGEYQDCDLTRPFINLQKDVFAIDYPPNAQAGTGIDPALACMRQQDALVSDGLVKDEALSSALRVQCTP
jgi:hypothetical protein